MALYQKSVLKKYIKQLDKPKVEKAYKKYVNHFLNPTIQENIRNSKEEEYQGIFLTDLFVNVLDYTLKPNANFNLVAEYKNQTNSRKADGAILFDNKAIGVIELKGTNTKDLESIRKQAFDYKANQKECVYVITSNYEKLRFYINDATEFEEFNLFELTKEQFELLYLCLHKEHIENNIPLKIKEASLLEEEQITKKFYKDYSLFKRELYRDLVKRNTKRIKSNLSKISTDTNEADLDEETKAELLKLEKNVKLNLFKKSQKLIDRFLFVFFAEDRGLLPPNSTLQILNKWKDDIDFGDDRPLYEMFKQYFKFLDIGRQGTTNRAEIYAYNGGLFKEDKVLDQLEIDNDLLFNHCKKLASYDFESQVDVNILGHIFENSLNEIESVNAEIEGGDFDKQKSKRKKDGVFYTPKYITKYIVENTIGKLCDEKKNELGFKEEEYFKGRKNRQQTTIIKLVEILDTYRDWLLQLTICDPACGSGAFLNQALDFLIKEHNYIDELKTKILGGGFVFSDIENTILENNIYGVDLNEESVEIAKLSLWLRTAQPRRKLNNLNSNIKCGNSLIESKTVAGDKAFNWQEQFPSVFEKGGFDVIIGNPPYISFQNIDNNVRDYLSHKYKSSTGKYDIYVLFIEKSLEILKLSGIVSFILPNKFILSNYGIGIKEVILENKIIELVDFKDLQIFEGATTYPCIITLLKNKTIDSCFNYLLINDNLKEIKGDSYQIYQNELNTDSWQLGSSQDKMLLDRIQNFGIKIKDISDFITQGFRTGKLDVYYNDITLDLINSNKLEKELIHLCFTGKNVKRYSNNVNDENDLILYPYLNKKPIEIDNFPNSKNYLETKREVLKNRKDSGKVFYQTNKKWFEYWDPKFIAFNKPKIVFPDISSENNFYLDVDGIPFLNTCYSIYLKDEKLYKPILSILNSKLFLFYVKMVFPSISGGYYRYKTSYIENFNIHSINNSFVDKSDFFVDCQISDNSLLTELNQKFQRTLLRKIELDSLPKKLEKWYELTFSEFIKELGKKKIKLSLTDEAEWEDYFLQEQQKAIVIKNKIASTDKEIDAMVYELYGLSDEEIAIVENS